MFIIRARVVDLRGFNSRFAGSGESSCSRRRRRTSDGTLAIGLAI